MVAVAVVTTPNDASAPDTITRRLFDVVPDVEIAVESFVPLGDSAVPYFWVRGDELDAFERTIGGYDEVSAVEKLERVEDGALYRIDWEIDSPMIQCIQDSGARLVDAHGTAERWKLTVWFEPGVDASALLECCHERGVPIEIERLHSVAEFADDSVEVVTPSQREALVAAYDHGYFEQPRETSQRDLARKLGISAPALGTRLRRGTANIVEHYVR